MPTNEMQQGIGIHVVWRSMFLLNLRDDSPLIQFPDCWDSVSGGIDPQDEGSPRRAAEREIEEEIGVVPKSLIFLGQSRAGHYIHVAFLTDEEADAIELGDEGQALGWFPLDQVLKLKKHGQIGGCLGYPLEVYEDAFRVLVTGRIPHPSTMGLKKLKVIQASG